MPAMLAAATNLLEARISHAMHLRPEGGWFGDPIPYYWGGTYHLYYLVDREHHAQPGDRHTWGHFASEDLVHWRELPMAIDLGPPGAVDAASCGTGAIGSSGLWR